MRVLAYSVLLAGWCFTTAASLCAESQNPIPLVTVAAQPADKGSFFSKGSAVSPFLPKPTAGEQEQVEMFPRSNTYVLPPDEELTAEDSPGTTKKNTTEQDLEKLPPSERLLSKYGDPAKDAPIRAIETAPGPFKAMMEALELHQDELAFQYAKQYTRHLKNLRERTTRIQSLVGFAGKREGVIDQNGWQGGPALIEDQELYQKDIEAASKAGARDTDVVFSPENALQRGKQELLRSKAQGGPLPGVPASMMGMAGAINNPGALTAQSQALQGGLR